MEAQLFFAITSVLLLLTLIILSLHFYFTRMFYRGRIEALENALRVQGEAASNKASRIEHYNALLKDYEERIAAFEIQLSKLQKGYHE